MTTTESSLKHHRVVTLSDINQITAKKTALLSSLRASESDFNPLEDISVDFTPEGLNNLGFGAIDFTPDAELTKQYRTTRVRGSSKILLGRNGQNRPILVKGTKFWEKSNLGRVEAIKRLLDQSIATKLTAMIYADPDFPIALPCQIKGEPFLALDYLTEAKDYDGDSYIYQRDQRILLNMVLGSVGDNSTQALVYKGKYIPIDVMANYSHEPTLEELIKGYKGDSTEHNAGLYGYRSIGELSQTRRSNLRSFASNLLDMGQNREAITRCFDLFPGTEAEKQTAIDEIARRMKMLLGVVSKMGQQGVI